VLLACLGGCGRVAFDVSMDDAGIVSAQLSYRDVRPLYLVGYPIGALTATATGPLSAFSVSPALPTGMHLDPAGGAIAGTPTVPRATTTYTVTAMSVSGPVSARLTFRTAEGFVVNNNGEASDGVVGDGLCETAIGNGQCTLRAAVMEVNAGVGPKSMIYILAQTITLSSTMPDAVRRVELVGESTATTIIDGGGGSLIGYGAGGVSITLSNLTYRNGARIAHNFNPNITFNADHVRVQGCDRFAETTGTGMLSITDSSFVGNTGNLIQIGGGTGTIARSLFANNTGNPNGMIDLIFGDIEISNNTFSNNSGSSSAIIANNAVVRLVHNTFAGNSATTDFRAGAFSGFSGSSTTWTNNLLVDNTGAFGNCSGTIESIGGNLVYPADGTCRFDAPTDRASADPMLAAPADNGGPTFTMALASQSPAIDAGLASGCAPIDQRGLPRDSTRCDIGAFEVQ
jgi:hypothetical protein